MKNNSHRNHYIIVVVCFMIVVCIIGIVLTQRTGFDNMFDSTNALEKSINGILTGDSASAKEGGRQLLEAIRVDLKNILIMAGVIIAGLAVLFVIYRIYRSLHRNKFGKEEKRDDYWNS